MHYIFFIYDGVFHFYQSRSVSLILLDRLHMILSTTLKVTINDRSQINSVQCKKSIFAPKCQTTPGKCSSAVMGQFVIYILFML